MCPYCTYICRTTFFFFKPSHYDTKQLLQNISETKKKIVIFIAISRKSILYVLSSGFLFMRRLHTYFASLLSLLLHFYPTIYVLMYPTIQCIHMHLIEFIA